MVISKKKKKAFKIISFYLAQFNKQLRDVYYQKLDIEKDITDSQQRVLNQERKVRVLDNLTEVASQSLTDYFDKVMPIFVTFQKRIFISLLTIAYGTCS